MHIDLNSETRSKLAWLAGISCALGGFIVGAMICNGHGDAMIFGCAFVGMIIGIASAYINTILSFVLILISAGFILHGCSAINSH